MDMLLLILMVEALLERFTKKSWKKQTRQISKFKK